MHFYLYHSHPLYKNAKMDPKAKYNVIFQIHNHLYCRHPRAIVGNIENDQNFENGQTDQIDNILPISTKETSGPVVQELLEPILQVVVNQVMVVQDGHLQLLVLR